MMTTKTIKQNQKKNADKRKREKNNTMYIHTTAKPCDNMCIPINNNIFDKKVTEQQRKFHAPKTSERQDIKQTNKTDHDIQKKKQQQQEDRFGIAMIEMCECDLKLCVVEMKVQLPKWMKSGAFTRSIKKK